MTAFLFSNFASTVLTTAVAADTTVLPVALATGDKFPNPGPNTAFRAVLNGIDGSLEVVECTARVGDNLTVSRAQEGTAALAFAAGSRLEMRLTAEVCRHFLQLSGGAMTGDLDLGGNKISNAVFSTNTTFSAGLRASSVKTLDGLIGIDLVNGRIPLIQGSEIITLARLARCIFPFYGRIEHLPYWFNICDGLNGTPDLRGQFIRGTSVRTPDEPAPLTRTGAQQTPTQAIGVVKTVPDGKHSHGGKTKPFGMTAATAMPITIEKKFKVNIEGGGSNTMLEDFTLAYGTGTVSHDHGLNEEPAHDHDVNVIPPSWWMFFVMFKPNLIPPTS